MNWPCENLKAVDAWKAADNPDHGGTLSERAQQELAGISAWAAGDHPKGELVNQIKLFTRGGAVPCEWTAPNVKKALDRLSWRLHLDERLVDVLAPSWTGQFPRGIEPDTSVGPGTMAYLRHGNVDIAVRVTHVGDEDVFFGVIRDFGAIELTHQGAACGDSIKFGERYLIGTAPN